MEALAFHEARPTIETLTKHILKLRFVETAKARLEEIEVLLLKTDAAIKMTDSRYWSRRHQYTKEDLEWLKQVNEIVILRLDTKREKR